MTNRELSFLLLALIVAGALLVLVLLLRAWRRPLQPPTLPRHPIVLVHGIMGFKKIGTGGLAFDYFRGTVASLERAGITVYAPRLPALGSVPARAAVLAKFITDLPHAKVNIVAHSMGGLDARWAIARLGIAERVAVLVTVATPHRGSPLAEAAAGNRAVLVRWLFARIGAATDALDWLTAAAAERMNAEAPDDPRVTYGSVVCTAKRQLWLHNPILYAPWRMLQRSHGDNDGLVPAASQRWGTVWFEVEHDHWSQVGWSLTATSRELYARIIAEIAARGG